MLSNELLYATTSDGLRLAIRRVAPEGQSRGAVLMQHGLASNGLCFTLPGQSLAEHLAEQGYDCYVTELRGAGDSDTPKAGWTLSDYLERDVPALLEAVVRTSGHPRVSWIGHSMGGFLALMYGIENPSAPIARVITVASSLDYRPGFSVHRGFARLKPLMSLISSVPYGWFSRLNARVAGSGPRFMPEAINFHRPNIEQRVCRELLAGGFTPIPTALLDSLSSSFSEDGFSRDTPAGRIVYLQRVHELTTPTLLLSGSRDKHCSELAVQTTFDALRGVADKQIAFFGRDHGHAENYGHFDLLLGKRARHEVWPHITAFLARGEALRPADAAEPVRRASSN
jgi:alpha-beta hydrolase superfamily lysophospholipase